MFISYRDTKGYAMEVMATEGGTGIIISGDELQMRSVLWSVVEAIVQKESAIVKGSAETNTLRLWGQMIITALEKGHNAIIIPVQDAMLMHAILEAYGYRYSPDTQLGKDARAFATGIRCAMSGQ